jgi:hypothetical protein
LRGVVSVSENFNAATALTQDVGVDEAGDVHVYLLFAQSPRRVRHWASMRALPQTCAPEPRRGPPDRAPACGRLITSTHRLCHGFPALVDRRHGF